jgi:polyketide cyclase/dehydrase/lipid transport protein
MAEAAAAVVIDAPIDVVWAAMLDTDAYPTWNPFIVRVGRKAEGPLAVGEQLVLHVKWGSGGGARATERISALAPPSADGTALLEYDYGGPLAALGLVRGRRRQRLDSLAPARTAYETAERLTGPLAWAAPTAKVQDGFERHANALKARAEELARRP